MSQSEITDAVRLTYEQWPSTRIRNTLKLHECIHQGRIKTITVDEATRLCQRVRDELIEYYEQRLKVASWEQQLDEQDKQPDNANG